MKHPLLLAILLSASVSSVIGQETIFKKISALEFDADYSNAVILIDAELKKNPGESQAALLQNKKAEVLIKLGNISEADSLLRQINSTDAFIYAITLSNTGFLNLNRARFDLALENLQSSLSKFKSIGQENSKEGAVCLANIALVFMTTGKYNQAEEYESIALQIRQKLFGELSEEVAASYNSLGLIHLSTDPERSLEYYEKALTTYQKLHDGDHPKIAIANTNMGISYLQLELYGDAVNHFDDAKKIWEKIYPNGHPNTALVLRNLGRTYGKMKNQSTALDYLNKAVSIYQKSYGEKHPDIAGTLNEIGLLLLGNNEYNRALIFFQNGLIANSPSFKATDLLQNPAANNYYNASVQINLLKSKTTALESRYHGKTLKLTDLKLALNCLYICDSLMDDIRHHSSDEGDKLALGELSSEVYEDGVNIAYLISENVMKPKKYLEKAFYFAEKSKSAVLHESIADSQAKSFSGIPSSLLEQEKSIKSAIADYVQKLAQKPLIDEEKRLRQSLFTSNNEYAAFIKKLEKDYPNYYNLKFSQSIATVVDIQKEMDKGTAVVSYFIAEKSNRLYLFTITSKKFFVLSHSLPKDFSRTLKGFSNSLLYSNFETYKKSGSVIGKLLAPQLPSKIKELILIPTGKLGTLPFEALPEKKIKGEDFKSVKYLIENYSIAYEFSASLLLQKSKTKSNIRQPTIFLCAPVTFPEKDNLNSLPGSEREINTIAQLFEGNSKAIKYADANETIIKSKELVSYDYLHFATHGIVDEENPEMSRIFLNTSVHDDGNLYASEIYNINLNANLAVLSACQTGMGKIAKGEGVIGLSRALVYAGAKNIVVSFWSVADESTAELMTDFYSFLLKSNSRRFGGALQEAKVKMIKSGKYSTPFYWAPFVLIGK
jgi:CHAT domain-containing protein/tetratricopeptide (TPR) repeat protein